MPVTAHSYGLRSRRLRMGGRGLVVAALCLAPWRVEAEPISKPVVALLGVRPGDDSVKAKDLESYSARLVTAMKVLKSFDTVTPEEIDSRAGGRVARTSLLDSLRPGELLEAGTPPGFFGDRVLIVTLDDVGQKHRARGDIYGTRDGTLYYTIFASRDRVTDLVHGIDEKLGPRPTKTIESSDVIKLVRASPVTAAPDWPLTVQVHVEPSTGISLTVHYRQEGETTFESLASAAIVEEAPGDYSLHFRPTRSGNLAFYITALKSDGEASDTLACADGNADTPNKIAIDDRETTIADLTNFGQPEAAPLPPPLPRPKIPPSDARSLANLAPPRLPNAAVSPAPNPAVPITAFTTAAIAAVVGAVFTLRTFSTASELRTCPSSSVCQAKTSALNVNQTVAWSMYGVTAAGVGVGGLALAFRW